MDRTYINIELKRTPLKGGGNTNVHIEGEFVELCTMLLIAIKAHPELRSIINTALIAEKKVK